METKSPFFIIPALNLHDGGRLERIHHLLHQVNSEAFRESHRVDDPRHGGQVAAGLVKLFQALDEAELRAGDVDRAEEVDHLFLDGQVGEVGAQEWLAHFRA